MSALDDFDDDDDDELPDLPYEQLAELAAECGVLRSIYPEARRLDLDGTDPQRWADFVGRCWEATGDEPW